MRFVAFAALPAIAVIACSTQSLNARDFFWKLTKDEGSAKLEYEQHDDSAIELTCTRGSGVIKVFVPTTDDTEEGYKPNQPINATLAAGSVRSSMAGKTRPGEDYYDKGFEGTLQATDPLLDAMARAKSLSTDVGASHGEVTLKGIGNMSREFATLCRTAVDGPVALKAKWQLIEDDRYAKLSSDHNEITLTCTQRNGVILVFVNETNPANATLAAGSVRSSTVGIKTFDKYDPTPIFWSSTLQATDPLLDAMARADSLSIDVDVGASHLEVTLKGIGNMSRELATVCRKR